MNVKQLLPGLICVAFLSACATTDPVTNARSHTPMAESMAAAETAVKGGKAEKAMEILHGAAKAHPADKAPWIRMAQLRYDFDDYGQAIVLAQEALKRDNDDMLGHSIAAVSGLRIASKALADLTRKNNLSGTVRSEAQDLAKLLRASLGEDVLVPGARTARAATPATPARKAPSPSAASNGTRKASASDDPFGSLQ
ncbi:MAG: tetratricopeptide repeat protein [Telluria sp.]